MNIVKLLSSTRNIEKE